MAAIAVIVGFIVTFAASLFAVFQHAADNFPYLCYSPKLGDVKEWVFLYSLFGIVFFGGLCYRSRRVDPGIRSLCLVAVLVIGAAGAYASTRACGCTCTGCQLWFQEWVGGIEALCKDI